MIPDVSSQAPLPLPIPRLGKKNPFSPNKNKGTTCCSALVNNLCEADLAALDLLDKIVVRRFYLDHFSVHNDFSDNSE